MNVDLKTAVQERETSEQKLREAQPLIISLRKMRERNHISGILDEIIENRTERK